MKRKEFTVVQDYNNRNDMETNLDSDYGTMISHIFGTELLDTIMGSSSPSSKKMNNQFVIQQTNEWIYRILEEIQPPVLLEEEDNRPGRLGKSQVRFDSTAQVGTLIMSADRLHAQGQSNFSSVRANVCFYSGKWQYEIQLETKGVMQLGWAMAGSEFSPESGVGDKISSYAFDGNRICKWNLVNIDYGEAWQVGDVIGCTIDLDTASIHFYRNGKDLGEAFSCIPLGPGCVYYPAVSLAFDEKIQANFGMFPFKYPVTSYQPLQQVPLGAVQRVDQILHWFCRISSIPKNNIFFKGTFDEPTRSRQYFEHKQYHEATMFMLCELLLSALSKMLNKPYVIEGCIVPFLQNVTNSNEDGKGLPARRSMDKLNLFYDSVTLFLEADDSRELINAMCKCLLHNFNQTSLSLDYIKQKKCLTMIADLLQNSNIRYLLLKIPEFIQKTLPEFMDAKMIDVVVLKKSAPEAWWNSIDQGKGHLCEEYETKKKNYFTYCLQIKNRLSELEQLQENVLLVILNNTDNNNNGPTSRRYFLHSFRKFLKNNHITNFLFNQNAEQTPFPIALNFFHRLVNVLRLLWGRECRSETPYVPLSTFYNGSVDYFTIDRLGGVLSYLIHTFHDPLAQELGSNHRVFTDSQVQQPRLPALQVQVRAIDTETGAVSTLTRWINVSNPTEPERPVNEAIQPDPVTDKASLIELLDGLVLLYNIAGHKQLHRVSILRDEVDKYITTLDEAKERLKCARKHCPEAVVEIENSIKTLERHLDEQSKVLMAWITGAVYTPEKRANLVWLLKAVLLTLETASQQGDLFGFVPDFYLETLVGICTALRNYFSPTVPVESLHCYKVLMVQVTEFLVNHYSDPRVVHLNSKDIVIEALAGFVSKRQTMDCVEGISHESQERFVVCLLKPYDKRPWGQSNWILMRMWQGCGFAFRYKKSPHYTRKLGPRTPGADSSLIIHQTFDPCPSIIYQQLIARILSENQDMANEFLNSVLKQLNWSFSEFISMMQEIQNLSKRPERVIIDARQLKICATCFDFVLGLLRVLEMVCTICPSVFTDTNRKGSANLLERLCQLIGQILLRVTTPTGCFTHVILLEVPDLDSIDQFPVLSAVVGVLVALLAVDIHEDNSTMTVAARTLLSEPSFQIDALKYVLGEKETNNNNQQSFSFQSYPDTVSANELHTVSHLISVLTRYKARMSIVKTDEDEEMCPICCSMPLDVTFKPCNHQSCKSCITHHLMDCKECFFCKTVIKSVVSVTDGKTIYASSKSTENLQDVQDVRFI